MMCAILAVTNTAKSQWLFQNGNASPYFPSNYYTNNNVGIGRFLQPPTPGVTFDILTYPKLLVHSTDDATMMNKNKGILRIQDVNYNESTPNMLGEPQLQFWSNEYQSMNQWMGGKIQMISNNTSTGIITGAANISGGLGFYSKPITDPITGLPKLISPTPGDLVETMKIIDNKVAIGYPDNSPPFKFNVAPNNGWNTDLFAVDYLSNTTTNAMLLKLYNRTGTAPVPPATKLPTYAWHIELPRSNTPTNQAPYGALNFCSSNTTVGVGDEVVNRLVTFTRDGKVGINNPQPKEALHVLGKARINKTGGPDDNEAPINSHSDYQLAVEGKIVAEEIIVNITDWGWPDYVFEENYNLPTLNEVESHIKANKHLPGIPSANEVITNGANIGEVQVKLLQKIEELTLYLIEQDKKIQELQNQINNK